MKDGKVFRWVLDVDSLWPAPPSTDGVTTKDTAHWATRVTTVHALNLLSTEERTKVLRFYRPSDAKLSLGSCLLKKRAITQTCHVSWQDAVINVDSNKKPCYTPPNNNAHCVEFNVSHHGTLVALVGRAGSNTRLGVDVVQMNFERDYSKVVADGFEAWAHIYEMVFSDREINEIANFKPNVQQDPREEIRAKLRHFYAHWCLKEAYIKMNGEALLASWLKDLEFHSVGVPRPRSQISEDIALNGEWGETCRDVEIWFRGQRVTDVQLEIQAYRDEYMIGTACSETDVKLSAFQELDVKEDVYP